MKRILAGALPLLAALVLASPASAHHVVKGSVTCTKVVAKFEDFSKQDGSVTWAVKVDGNQVANGMIPAFYGDKYLTVNLPVLSKGNHTIEFTARWHTSSGYFKDYVKGCPGPPPPPNCENTPSMCPPPPTCENTPSLCPPPPPVVPPTPPVPPVPPVPPTCATNPELCPPPPPEGKEKCVHETTGNISIRKRGHHYWLRGKNLSKFRWRVDGKLIGKKRSVRVRSYSKKHTLEVRARLNECQKVRRTKTLPRHNPGPPRFTG